MSNFEITNELFDEYIVNNLLDDDSIYIMHEHMIYILY